MLLTAFDGGADAQATLLLALTGAATGGAASGGTCVQDASSRPAASSGQVAEEEIIMDSV